MICLPGIRLARRKHMREVEAIANHPACRGFLRGEAGERFRAREWSERGAVFYLFDGGWLGVTVREPDAAEVHIAALPGYRGEHALEEGMRVVEYLLEAGSPFNRLVAIVNRRNRPVRALATAAGFQQVKTEGEWCEYRLERSDRHG